MASDLVNQGLEGYFRDSGFDQNTVQRKAGFGKLMKSVRDAGFSPKRGENAGSGSPFQTLVNLSPIHAMASALTT